MSTFVAEYSIVLDPVVAPPFPVWNTVVTAKSDGLELEDSPLVYYFDTVNYPTYQDVLYIIGPNGYDCANQLMASANLINNIYTNAVLSPVDGDTYSLIDSKQPASAALTSLSGFSQGAGKIPYGTGSGIGEASTTSYGRGLVNLANQAALQTAVGVGAAGLSNKSSDLNNDAGFINSSALSSYATTSALTTGLATKQDTLSAMAFANPSRSLNTAFQISATKNTMVSYSVDISCTMSLTSGQSGSVVLEYADDSGFTTNVKTVSNPKNSNAGTLTIGLSLTQINTATLAGVIPAGKYVRLRTVNNTGTPTFTLQNSQEVQLPA